MRNSRITKSTLIEVSSKLFNTKGYRATSISDITQESGFTKGAIYRHFGNKETLEIASFQHLMNNMTSAIRIELKVAKNAPDKLKAITNFYRSYAKNPPIVGGCPLLNATIEIDDSYPALHKIAADTLTLLNDTIIQIVNTGKNYNQINKETDANLFANIFIAITEGAIMMNKLQPNKNYLLYMCKYLDNLIEDMAIKN